MNALGEEMAARAIQGLNKRKRIELYERGRLPQEMEKQWKTHRENILRQIEEGDMWPVFLVDTQVCCRQYVPDINEVMHAMPKEMQGLRSNPCCTEVDCGYFLTIREDGANTGKYKIVFDITNRVNALVEEGALEQCALDDE